MRLLKNAAVKGGKSWVRSSKSDAIINFIEYLLVASVCALAPGPSALKLARKGDISHASFSNN